MLGRSNLIGLCCEIHMHETLLNVGETATDVSRGLTPTLIRIPRLPVTSHRLPLDGCLT